MAAAPYSLTPAGTLTPPYEYPNPAPYGYASRPGKPTPQPVA
ncbi:hypothetical protein Spla01_00734 [Streptomyces platensis]|uniref:Uncharacterized protein n=1 Tax=Streptomyces platensis TaxID=58346 RepID=A0ABX3XRL4_STRPT|nr:hypothetical protein BG653_05285 [Streptomyces platensis]